MNTFTENLYLRDCFMNPLTHDIMTLYDIAIRAYGLAIRLASPFNKKAALWVKGRRSIWKRLAAVERGNGRLVWFHAASLGEFEQGRPVMERLREIEPPKLILGEIDRTSAMLRDILNPSFENIYVNDLALSKEIKNYIRTIAPEKENIVKFVTTEIPIFDYFGVDKQIKSSLGRTVSFKNGAYLIIEHTEAFHVIDVNSGNRVKLGDDQETNALEVNLAAADEIARQLQLRDMGGIIVIDYIDMQTAEHRQKLYERMKAAMEIDRAKHTILPLSKFGLMQITRQRVRPEMSVKTMETCPVCHGTGKAEAAILVIDKIEEQLEYLVQEKKMNSLVLKVHPFIEAYLKKGLWSQRWKWARKFHVRLKVLGVPSYYIYEYKFFNRFNREIEEE